MRVEAAPRIPWPVFLVTVAGAFVVALDLSIVNVAFPSIKASFPEVVDDDALLGAVRLQRGVRRPAARRRTHRRPLGPAALVPPGHRRVHARLAAVRRRHRPVDAHRRPGRAGRRRRAADAGLARPAARRHRRRRSGPRPWPCGAASPPSPSPPARRSARCSSTPAAGGGPSSSTCPSSSSSRVVTRRVVTESVVGGPPPDLVGVALLSLAVASLALGITQGDDWGWTSAAVLGLLRGVARARRVGRAAGPGPSGRRPSTCASSRTAPSPWPTPPPSPTPSASSPCSSPTCCSSPRCGSTPPSRPAWPSHPVRWWWRR